MDSGHCRDGLDQRNPRSGPQGLSQPGGVPETTGRLFILNDDMAPIIAAQRAMSTAKSPRHGRTSPSLKADTSCRPCQPRPSSVFILMLLRRAR